MALESHFHLELNQKQNLSHFQVSNPAANKQSGASGLSGELGSSFSLNDDVVSKLLEIKIYFEGCLVAGFCVWLQGKVQTRVGGVAKASE